MKKILFLFCLFSFLVISAYKSEGKSLEKSQKYYIDAELGKDSNSGTSPDQAWKTLEKINSSVFKPGDKILLKRGSVWIGHIELKQSGLFKKPITIADYGNGDLPKINVNATAKDGILLKNISHITVKNIEITNFDASVDFQKNGPTGLRILAENIGTISNIHLFGLYIHDINGDNKKGSNEGNGIYWECKGPAKSNIENLKIEKCIIKKVDRNGIRGNGTFAFRDNWFPNKNLTIKDCLLEDIGGDGIVVKAFDGALIEHNKLFKMRARAKDNAVAVWPHSSDNTVIQYNEVAFTKNQDWSNDGQSFDIDGNCNHTTIQNNYSHDNEGGFMLVISDDISAKSMMTKNNIIRYNLSVNDGLNRKRLFNFAGTTDSTLVYNNIFINNSKTNLEMELVDLEHSLPKNIVFKQNEFRYSDGVSAKFSKSNKQYQTIQWIGNLFAGNFLGKDLLVNNVEGQESLQINLKRFPWKFMSKPLN